MNLLDYLLGRAGYAMVGWLLDHSGLVSTILAFYFAIYLAGRIQLQRIIQKSENMVVEAAVEMAKENKRVQASKIRRQLYPQWSERLKEWAWFIPHRLELLVVPVSLRSVEEKFSFSKEWVAEVLQKNGLIA